MPPHRWLAPVLRLFFRFLYNEFAWTYDCVAWAVSLGRWRRWVSASLPYLAGPRVLELGHGPGHLLNALAQRGIPVIGVDSSRRMSRQAARRLRKQFAAGALPGGPPALVCAKAPDLPFAASSFDQVVATFPSEYIFLPVTLLEINRLLRAGGSLIVLPYAWITSHRWLDRLAAGLFRVTGQAPDWDKRVLIPFTRAGFNAVAQAVDLDGSQVMLIVAKKP